MENEIFNDVIEQQIERCTSVLLKKQKEYATADRLHNFNVASELQGLTPRQALAGMMSKHTVSIYDMCVADGTYTLPEWDEKITDHINYLLLLRAVVEDEYWKNRPRLYADGEIVKGFESDAWGYKTQE